MPTPMIVQAMYQPGRLGTAAMTTSPNAMTIVPVTSTLRPPTRSIRLPTRGDAMPAISNDQENPPSNTVGDVPSVVAAAPMMTAGI